MPNTYFIFKQFTVHQEKTAMKVCTDSCLFGAWVATYIPNAKRVLDIGAGTGVLSLMYAQKNPETLIDVVEIDPAAAEQAVENFIASPWSNRLSVCSGDIKFFTPVDQYDLIISNPPFFEKDLRSLHSNRNNAMHDTSLTLEELSSVAEKQLLPGGKFVILLPYHRMEYFIEILKRSGWHLFSQVLIKQSPLHSYFRSMLCCSRENIEIVEKEDIVIKEQDQSYSSRFTNLLKDYYLYM